MTVKAEFAQPVANTHSGINADTLAGDGRNRRLTCTDVT